MMSVAIVLVATVAQVVAAEPKAETALEAAKRYTNLMKGDEPIKAVETFWDFPEMLQTMFGERLKASSQAERDEMKKLLLDFFRGIYSNPQIAEAMKKATFEDFLSTEKEGKTFVTFKALIGDQKLPNILVFKQIDEKWRVVDAAASNQPLLAETFGKEYLKHADRLTPLAFLKAMTNDAP